MADETPKKTVRVEEGHLKRLLEEYRKEAEQGRQRRIARNKRNWEAYYGRQDWSEKQEGQSREFLPKTSEAVEQFAAFTKRALTQFGDWFSVEPPRNSPIDGNQIRALMRRYLERLIVGPSQYGDFATSLGQSLKAGLLESLMVLKVHGHKCYLPSYDGNYERRQAWRARIDLIPSNDYYPDPTGRGLYEIHEVERDVFDVVRLAKQGIYDLDAVREAAKGSESTRKSDPQARKPADANQSEATTPSMRRTCVLSEVWGALLDENGDLLLEKCRFTFMNGTKLIRKPSPWPFWHGESPFVVAPLCQVPFTVWGKALYDDGVDLNIAQNELFNLMLDAGIGSVWGVKQVRRDWLENPDQISGGIKQAMTLLIKNDIPVNAKVVESLTATQIPPDAVQIFNLLDREGQASFMTNDLRMGFLPPRAVKATEVTEQSSSNAVMTDSIAGDIERNIVDPTLRKTWLNMLQHADDLLADDVVDTIGKIAANQLANMKPRARYQMFATGTQFRATGLTATLARTRDFQRLMALAQTLVTNPLMMRAFMQKFSADKMLQFVLKSLNLNPHDILKDETESTPQARAAEMQDVMGLNQLTSGQPTPASPPGQGAAQSEIAQNAEPTGSIQ